MPSYLEKEQFVPIKPFLAPMEAILNTYKTRLQYWGYGAGQVKATQDQYNNLELTREDNQSRLSQYMTQAQGHVNAAAQTDLSVADNRDNALSAFTPINKDMDIMGDHANTEHWNALKSRYDSARVRNGGKEFNQAGYDAVNYQQQLFKMLPKKIGTSNGGQVDSWKMFYANKEQYMPYYDKTEEIKKLSDMFKTDVVDKTGAAPGSPGYLLHSKNASWDKDKWQSFVQTNASPQLKAQLALEGRADLRKSLVLTNGDVGTVYNAYNQQFTALRDQRVQEYGDKLASYKLALQSLDKSSPDYSRLRKEYSSAIEELEGNKTKGVAGAIEKLRQQNLDPKSISLDNLQGAEATAADLYQRNYFEHVGKDFAHKDIVEEYKMDGAYFANKNLQARYAEMTQEANQFKAEMDYKWKYSYDKLAQEKSIAEMNKSVSLAIAGMKLDAKGNVVPIGADGGWHDSNGTTNAGPADLTSKGKAIVEAYEGAMGMVNGTMYDAIQGEYFGAPGYIQEMTKVDGSTPLNEVVTVGGDEAHDKVAGFLATAYWGKDLYRKLGIDTSEPVKAQAAFKERMMTSSVANVKGWLNMAFSNKGIREAALQKLKGTEKGMKFAIALEAADKEMESNIEGYNKTYGPAVKQVLAKYAYPAKIPEDSEAYKQGARGYAQDGDGKFRIPTKEEIKIWEQSRYTPEQKTVLSRIDKLHEMFLLSRTNPEAYKKYASYTDASGRKNTLTLAGLAQQFGLEREFKYFNDEGVKVGPYKQRVNGDYIAKHPEFFKKAMANYYSTFRGDAHLAQLMTEGNNIRNDMFAAIGARGAAGLKDKVHEDVLDTKNTAYFRANKIVPILETLDNNNDDNADELKNIILRNPADAVTSIREIRNGVDGKTRVQFVIDDNKLNKEDKDAYQKLVGKNITFSSTSEVLEKNYTNADYLTVLERPKRMTIDFPGEEDAVITLRNVADRDKPKFVIEGTYHVPVMDAQGNFMFNDDGTVKLNQANEKDFKRMLSMSIGGDIDKEINKNPIVIYQDAYMKAYKMRELIKYINTNKAASMQTIPESFREELETLK